MRLTQEESRALAFIGGMILLSVLGRWVDRPKPLHGDLVAVNIDSLEAASRKVVPRKGKAKTASRTRGGPIDDSVSRTRGRSSKSAPKSRTELLAEWRAQFEVPASDGVSALSSTPTAQGRSAFLLSPPHNSLPRMSSPHTLPERMSRHSASFAERSITRITGVLPETAPGPTSHTEKSASVRIVNLNIATASELEQLPRVGRVLAARIIAYRDSVGRFANVDALGGVKGVGPAMLERLRPYVRAP